MNTAVEYIEKTAKNNEWEDARRPLRRGEAKRIYKRGEKNARGIKKKMKKIWSDSTRPLKKGEAERWADTADKTAGRDAAGLAMGVPLIF